MTYYLHILRAFLTHSPLPRCHTCRRYCVGGWHNLPHATKGTGHYARTCNTCYVEENNR